MSKSVPRGREATAEKGDELALHDFSELTARELRTDSEFRSALLSEALATFAEGDRVTGQLMLRDYVNAALGFEELGRRLGKSPKSLMRMLSPAGNPRADNLLAILKALTDHEGITFKIEAVRAG